MGWPQSYDCRELNFGDRVAPRSSDMSTCIVAGVIGIVVYMLIVQPKEQYAPMVRAFPHSAGMLSSVVENVSARIADVTATVGKTATVKAEDVYRGNGIVPEAVVLVDAPDASKDADAYKTMDDAAKEKNASAVRKWLESNKTGIIMVFAPWCGHCHNAMGPFSEVASKSQLSSLMINAETVPSHMITGPQSIVSIEYFPTFLCKNGAEIKTVPTPEKAVDELVATSAAVADILVEESETSPFDGLF